MLGEKVANQLRKLISQQQITQIDIYRFADGKFHNRSNVWSFGHEFLDVGGQPYNLNRILSYKVTDQVLQLYF